MPIEPLFACRDLLVLSYREKLGLEVGEAVSELGESKKPVWLTVSGDDLISERSANSVDRAGLLLDPEIGLLAYILPFSGGTVLRKQIARALTLRSRLSIERNYTGEPAAVDEDPGAWRIVLHWMVNVEEREAWTNQIIEVRRETAFSEEIAMDALFIGEGPIEPQIESYGFPRLLLTTREVLKKQRLDEMTSWLSANKLVENALSQFASGFNKSAQRVLAEEVVRAMYEFNSGPQKTENDPAPDKPKTIESIHIRNFRNLKDARFAFGKNPVSASIVHGPNGTGKSSLCEALSLSLFRSSFRYKAFSDRNREKDVSANDRGKEYIAKYLTPIDRTGSEPKIALDEQDFVTPNLITSDKAEGVDLSMNGTILTQDSSLEFTRMPAHELGARVLSGYSDLADHIEQFTESRVIQANTLRQDFLRGLGLSASITRAATAYERIAKREIDLAQPPLPNSLVTWLEAAEGSLLGQSVVGLSLQWRAWGELGRNELAAEFAGSNANETKLTEETRRWLIRFNELAIGSAEVIKAIEARVEGIRTELDNASSKVTAWGEWLERRASKVDVISSPEAEPIAKKLQELQTLQKQLIERGRSAGGRFDHLTAVEAFVRETWSKDHAEECPTCGTDHTSQGGILKVVEVLRAQTLNERDRLRLEFNNLKTQIEQTQKQLAELGQTQCPLSSDEQSKLAEALQWLVPINTNLSDWIGVKSQRDTLLTAISSLREIPRTPSSIDMEGSLESFVRKVLSRFREADETFEAPNNWKPVKEKLTQTLAGIVNEHLPRTLEKLWRELALNLTAAPWLLPDSFRIDVVTRRGEQASTIRVQGRLARYILNQAEIHTLGLAWFFTRHLTRGRFFHACMVMDDPAHELDQTSFRDLCRLWETMMRLHRVYHRPLKLIVMLNQESRAVEAARATGAVLSVLGWEREQEDQSVRSINVIGQGFHAPQPEVMFTATAA